VVPDGGAHHHVRWQTVCHMNVVPLEDKELDRLATLIHKLADVEVDPGMWSQIVDSLPNGLIVINETGRIHLVNVQTELMFGYHRSRLIGELVHVLLDASMAEAHAAHIERFFRSPTARPMNLAKYLQGRHASGRPITVQISIGPLISEAGVFGLAIVRRVIEAPDG
jgi:PAS domain S-box-containing protein